MMKTLIDVSDRKEAKHIRDGLNDPMLRAQVKIAGILARLPSDRSRARVLRFVYDAIQENIETASDT